MPTFKKRKNVGTVSRSTLELKDHCCNVLNSGIVNYRNGCAMRLFTSFIIFGLTICSCNKKNDVISTFTGNLPIVSTNSPTVVNAGQNINSNVRCQLSSLSGSVYFQSFDITEVSTRQFHITAKALYKDWNMEIGMPVMWILDTIVAIKTTLSGKYILNFYNSALLFKSDTVQVN